jgi:hypothetical protein
VALFKKETGTDAMIASILIDIENIKARLDNIEKYLREKEAKELEKAGGFVSRIFGFEGDEDFDKLVNICSNIATKDQNFVFDYNRDSKEIFIYGDDKDSLHKRAMWLVKKTEIKGLKYSLGAGEKSG